MSLHKTRRKAEAGKADLPAICFHPDMSEQVTKDRNTEHRSSQTSKSLLVLHKPLSYWDVVQQTTPRHQPAIAWSYLIYINGKTPNLISNVNVQERNTIYISLRSLHCHTLFITSQDAHKRSPSRRHACSDEAAQDGTTVGLRPQN